MPELLKWTYNLGTWKAKSSLKVSPESTDSIFHDYSIHVSEAGKFHISQHWALKVGSLDFGMLDDAMLCCELREREIRKEAKEAKYPRTAISIECSDAGEWTVKSPSITGMMADQLDAGEALVLLAALIITPQRREGIINGLSVPK